MANGFDRPMEEIEAGAEAEYDRQMQEERQLTVKEGYAMKKPIPVHFVRWDGIYGEPAQVLMPGPGLEHLLPVFGVLNSGIVKTLEGEVVIREGDYLMGPGAGGEYWPIRKEIFEKTYDRLGPGEGESRHE